MYPHTGRAYPAVAWSVEAAHSAYPAAHCCELAEGLYPQHGSRLYTLLQREHSLCPAHVLPCLSRRAVVRL